jgi:hypothetical protein
MALDVQPLSPQRRIALVLLLVALFGASVGFAQWLVVLRQHGYPKYQVRIQGPLGMTELVPAYEALDGVVVSGQGRLKEFNNRLRQFVAFSYEANVEDMNLEEEATDRFRDACGQIPETRSSGILAGRPALELDGQYGDRESTMFVLLRMTALPGRVVAICYSGEGNLTDADRAVFDAFCAKGVEIRRVEAQQPPRYHAE